MQDLIKKFQFRQHRRGLKSKKDAVFLNKVYSICI